MCEKDEIHRAYKIDKTARRTREPRRARSQRSENAFNCKLTWNLNAGVMTAERVQLVRIGRGDQWFPEPPRHSFRAPVRIEQAFVKMAELNGVEAIDFRKQPLPN